MKRLTKHGSIAAACVWLLAISPASAQDNLGTSFGIPNSSPGVFCPRGSSLESLGFGRLYPNGPEFGLSNTAGGFGVSGSGRLSGVGLAERSVPTFVQEQLERPYIYSQRLTDAYSSESARATSIFNTAVGNQFRSEIRIGSASKSLDSDIFGPSIQQSGLINVDAVLHDRPTTPDAVLHTGL